MNNTNQNILNVTLFIAIIVCFTIGAIAYTPVLIIYFLGVLRTLTVMRIGNKNNKEFADTVTIFLSSLFFGFLLAFMVNMDFLQEGETFRYPDQMHFFESARIIGFQSSISSMLNYIGSNFTQYHIVYLMFGMLAYLDVFVSNTINFLPLLVSVVYTTALIPVFLYHILKKYLPKQLSLYASLYYGRLTVIMAYSGYLLRDNHVSLLTMIALFWMVRDVSFKRILLIVMLFPIVASMRLSNSLLILAMLAIYIFTGNTTKHFRFSFTLIAIIFLIAFSGRLIETISSTSDRLDLYIEYTGDAVESIGGRSVWLHSLPPVIKETGIFISALFTFPFGTMFKNASSFPQFFMVVYDTITEIGWYLIFVGLVFFIKPIYKRLIKMPNKMFLYLAILFILFMYANTTNMVFRRITCVIPFVYIPLLIVYNDATETKKTKFKTIAFSSCVLLIAISVFIFI